MELYVPLVKDRVQLRKELERVIKEESFSRGTRIENVKLAVDEQEFKNLRFLALNEKDITLTDAQKPQFDMIDATTNKPIAHTDPNYEAELQSRIQNLRAILKK
jgi:regulatory protein YycI of two-component signal transduction system YycFG